MEELKQPKTKFNWVWWIVLLLLACVITGSAVYYFSPDIEKIIENKDEDESQGCIVCEDTVDIAPTIQEILEFREHIREQNRIDSIFLTMPDVVLIDILINYGTNIDESAIVYIYEANPEIYNAVKSGAIAQKYKDKLQNKTDLTNISE